MCNSEQERAASNSSISFAEIVFTPGTLFKQVGMMFALPSRFIYLNA